MQLIQKLLDHALKESVLLEESRQVIAYAMLHPMYENNPNDRATLNQYSQQVVILISNYIFTVKKFQHFTNPKLRSSSLNLSSSFDHCKKVPLKIFRKINHQKRDIRILI